MNEQNLGGTPAEFERQYDDFDAAWTTFSQRLANYLAEMQRLEHDYDMLAIELPSSSDPEGCAPYAQFKALEAPGRIRAEASGDWYLAPAYTCRDHDRMEELGWTWVEEGNWWIETSVAEATSLARTVVAALRECFDIAHPQLLTFHGSGPGIHRGEELGLTSGIRLAIEEAVDKIDAFRPKDRDHLVEMVGKVLAGDGEVPPIDADGDFVLDGPGQPIWVRVFKESPALQIMAVPAYDVHSRKATAVELSLLNRDSLFCRWSLRDRCVWQTITLPGSPFVPEQLNDLLGHFTDVLTSTRGDLALRCGGRGAA